MIYRKHYDNVQLEGKVQLKPLGRQSTLTTLIAAGVRDRVRFVDLIIGDTTFRMHPGDARELADMLLSAAKSAEIIAAERRGGPIYLDESGDWFEQ
jgi:hypothetical protein